MALAAERKATAGTTAQSPATAQAKQSEEPDPHQEHNEKSVSSDPNCSATVLQEEKETDLLDPKTFYSFNVVGKRAVYPSGEPWAPRNPRPELELEPPAAKPGIEEALAGATLVAAADSSSAMMRLDSAEEVLDAEVDDAHEDDAPRAAPGSC